MKTVKEIASQEPLPPGGLRSGEEAEGPDEKRPAPPEARTKPLEERAPHPSKGA